MSLKKFLFVVGIIIILNACSDAAKEIVGTTFPPSTIEVVSVLSGATVTLYDFSTGVKGEQLATAKTDSGGISNIDLTSSDKQVLIELTNGSYIETSSKNKITLTEEQTLRASFNHVSGQNYNITVSYFTHIATALVEYLSANGANSSKAVVLSHDRVSDIFEFDIHTTAPIDITDIANQTPILTNEHKQGLLLAGISLLTKSVSEQTGTTVHSLYNSIVYAQKAYIDIYNDGKLNGVDITGQAFFGNELITTNSYKHDLAVETLVVTNDIGINKTAIEVLDLLPLFNNIDTSPDDLFSSPTGGTTLTPVPNVIDSTIKEGNLIGGNLIFGATVASSIGLKSLQFEVIAGPSGQTNIGAAMDLTDPKIDFDTTVISDGFHTLRISAENHLGKIGTLDIIDVEVGNVDTSLTNHIPALNSLIGGTSSLSYQVNEPLGIKNIVISVPGHVPVETTSANPSFTVDTSIIGVGDGLLSIPITVTNNVDRVKNFTYDVLVDNTKPTVSISLPKLDDIVGSTINYSVTLSDVNTIQDVTYNIGSSVAGSKNLPASSETTSFGIDSLGLAQGNHAVSVLASDGINTGSATVARVFYDKLAPTLFAPVVEGTEPVVLPDMVECADPITIGFRVGDDATGSGIASVTIDDVDRSLSGSGVQTINLPQNEIDFVLAPNCTNPTICAKRTKIYTIIVTDKVGRSVTSEGRVVESCDFSCFCYWIDGPE